MSHKPVSLSCLRCNYSFEVAYEIGNNCAAVQWFDCPKCSKSNFVQPQDLTMHASRNSLREENARLKAAVDGARNSILFVAILLSHETIQCAHDSSNNTYSTSCAKCHLTAWLAANPETKS